VDLYVLRSDFLVEFSGCAEKEYSM